MYERPRPERHPSLQAAHPSLADDGRHDHGKYVEVGTGDAPYDTWKHEKKSRTFTLTSTVTGEDTGVYGICYEQEMETARIGCGYVVVVLAARVGIVL